MSLPWYTKRSHRCLYRKEPLASKGCNVASQAYLSQKQERLLEDAAERSERPLGKCGCRRSSDLDPLFTGRCTVGRGDSSPKWSSASLNRIVLITRAAVARCSASMACVSGVTLASKSVILFSTLPRVRRSSRSSSAKLDKRGVGVSSLPLTV